MKKRFKTKNEFIACIELDRRDPKEENWRYVTYTFSPGMDYLLGTPVDDRYLNNRSIPRKTLRGNFPEVWYFSDQMLTDIKDEET